MANSDYKPPYMKWYDQAFWADNSVNRRMTWLQRHLYRALCIASFFCKTRPYLPDDDSELWVLADAESLQMWMDNKEPIIAMFKVSGGEGLLGNKRVLEEWQDLTDVLEKNRKAGQASAKKRANGCSTDVQRMFNGCQPTSTITNTSTKTIKTLSSDDVELLEDHTGFDVNSIISRVWSYYLATTGKDPVLNTLTEKRIKKAKTRLAECLVKTKNDPDKAEQLMKLAIDGIARSDWHMGRDPRSSGKKYCDWEKHVFGNYETMEKWWQ